jgi:hypothetical protein
MKDSNSDSNIISELQTPSIPIWKLSKPSVDLDLSKDEKTYIPLPLNLFRRLEN